MKYLIIGAGAAGLSAAESIRKYDKKGTVTVLSKDEHDPYSLCALPSFLAGELDKKGLLRFDKKWFKDNKISLRLAQEVLSIDNRKKQVSLSTGRPIRFDKLLIASGSVPIIPDIRGSSLDGIFTLNSLDDCLKINRWLKELETNHLRKNKSDDKSIIKAVIIGGGFIGIESAISLRQRGLDVAVVEMMDSVLPRMIDRDVNKLIVAHLKNSGIKIKLDTRVDSIEGDGKVRGLITSTGRLKADLIILCVGVKPNIDFLKGTGIRAKNGIKVNPKMQTTNPDIFAAGDIIRSDDLITGADLIHANWPNAVEQGAVAGSNMAGHYVEYNGAVGVNVVNIGEVPVVSVGLNSEDNKNHFGKNWKAYTRVYGKGKVPKLNRAIFAEGKITGFQAIGKAVDVGWLTTMLRSGVTVPDNEHVRNALLNDNLKSKMIVTKQL